MKIKFILFAILIGLFIFPNFANSQTNYWFPSGVQLRPVLNTWGINLSGTSTLSTTTISNLIITGTCTGCGGGTGGLATSSPFTAGYIPYATSTNSLTNSNIFQLAGGFVGIGTTTPSTTLMVYGTSTFMGGRVGIGTTTPAYTLDVWGSVRYRGLVNSKFVWDNTSLEVDISGSVTQGYLSLDTAAAQVGFGSNYLLAGLNDASWYFNNAEVFRIDSGTAVRFTPNDGAQYAVLDFSNIAATTKTFTLPNVTGTFFTTGNATSITIVGNVATGTWQGTAIADAYVADDITLTNITQITNRNLSNLQGTLSIASTTGVLTYSQLPINIASSSTPLSTFSGTLAIASTTGLLTYDRGGTGTSTILALQNLWWGDGTGKLVQVASSTLASASGVSSLNGNTGAQTLWGTSGNLTVTASGTAGLVFNVPDNATTGSMWGYSNFPLSIASSTTLFGYSNLPLSIASSSTLFTYSNLPVSIASSSTQWGYSNLPINIASSSTPISTFSGVATYSQLPLTIASSTTQWGYSNLPINIASSSTQWGYSNLPINIASSSTSWGYSNLPLTIASSTTLWGYSNLPINIASSSTPISTFSGNLNFASTTGLSTTTGNLIVASSTSGFTTLQSGASGQVLFASSSALTGIGWQNLPATSLTGGQTNYVPIWTSATTLGTTTITKNPTFNFLVATTTVPSNKLSSKVVYASTITEVGCWSSPAGSTTVAFYEATEASPNASSSTIFNRLISTTSVATSSTFADSAVASRGIITAQVLEVTNSSSTYCHVTYTTSSP